MIVTQRSQLIRSISYKLEKILIKSPLLSTSYKKIGMTLKTWDVISHLYSNVKLIYFCYSILKIFINFILSDTNILTLYSTLNKFKGDFNLTQMQLTWAIHLKGIDKMMMK